MEWIVAIGDSCLETLAWILGLTAVFGILVRFMPCNRGMGWWRDSRAAATDLLYWFVAPVLLRYCRTWILAAGVVLFFGGGPPGFQAIREMRWWQQCLAILVIQDLLLYWIHRVFHTRLGWNFHAIHHSPQELDWMSASRFHVVNSLLSFIVADVVVLWLGFAPAALFGMASFNIVYSSMVHANLNWTFGPLRYVFASPVFHRWHHTAEGAGLDKNFASTFPILDVIFGTFHMPAGELPQQFGNGAADFPEDYWGQLLHPFRIRAATETSEVWTAQGGEAYDDTTAARRPLAAPSGAQPPG